ncbi:hypothetical protein [Sodalis sp.]|uniref:hypothetical protein n=1 Tax=Sodalis sp. (in: enterobacteria) TaxID=1898979 RepID=UPI003872CC13
MKLCCLPLSNWLIEHKQCFCVTPSVGPTPDPDKAMAWRWQAMLSVVVKLASEPEVFTPWFR